MLALAAAALAAAGAGPAAGWPPFLPAPAAFAPTLVAAVERVWTEPTFARTVESEPAPVPFATYVFFVDAPEVTAAAARRLGLAPWEVRRLDEDWYEADDRDGARGVYRVLHRAGGRRVILSWGTHSGALLGTIGGSALTVLDFDDLGDRTGQRLTAHVLIDNRLAARLARALVPLFGALVDRKLTAGFRVTARVAAWAEGEPDAFCRWLAVEFSGRPAPTPPPARCAAAAVRPPGR